MFKWIWRVLVSFATLAATLYTLGSLSGLAEVYFNIPWTYDGPSPQFIAGYVVGILIYGFIRSVFWSDPKPAPTKEKVDG